jgi:hypothetical protein
MTSQALSHLEITRALGSAFAFPSLQLPTECVGERTQSPPLQEPLVETSTEEAIRGLYRLWKLVSKTDDAKSFLKIVKKALDVSD